MEQKYESVLRFNKYVVNEVLFKKNESYIQEDKETSIDFNIYTHTTKNGNNMEVKLNTQVFYEAKKNNYPFEMQIIITGYFTEVNNTENTNYEPHAISILYPYIRAIVSTYTANANVNALILPAINVNKLIEEQGNK